MSQHNQKRVLHHLGCSKVASEPRYLDPSLTVALCGGPTGEGHRVLHGGAQPRVTTVGVADSSSIDVERGVLGGESGCSQRVGGVSEG